MPKYELVKAERISLKQHPELTERWVEDQIALDPGILGLGDLTLRDKQRRQPRAGRLDLLLQDPDSFRRYEVEIQLGATDETHIIRTLEYWDIERKRYSQYEHCAVIVAEEITARLFNIIGLFNGFIPLIALKMEALRMGERQIALRFTKVLDEIERGLEEDDEPSETADRSYWEKRINPGTLDLVDQVHALIRSVDSSLVPNYTKRYIGVLRNDRPHNFVRFIPSKSHLNVGIRLPENDEITREIEQVGLPLVAYDRRRSRYRVKLSVAPTPEQRVALSRVIGRAYSGTGG